MSATRTSAPANNYACDVLLSKQNDSTTGISGAIGGTDGRSSAPYVVNAGSDALPVIQGSLSLPGGFATAPAVPAGALISTTAVTALANTTNFDLSGAFPANSSGMYSVSFVCNVPGQQWNMSGVGRIIRVAGVITSTDGFSATAVGSALLGTSPNQTVAFCEIASNSSGAIGLYNSTGVALTGVVKVYKIASSN